MKKPLRRYFCLVLVLVMCFSLMPVSAFADEIIQETEYENPVDPISPESFIYEEDCSGSDEPEGGHIHSYVFVPEIPAGEEAGVAEHYECEECGGFFILEQDLYVEVDFESLIIPAADSEEIEPSDEILAKENGGKWGELEWMLSGNNKTLTIFGEGAMTDAARPNDTPWSNKSNNIDTVVIEEGVTSVGSNVFGSFTKLTDVTLPATLTVIGNSAFEGCSKLDSLALPLSLNSIGENAFSGCDALSAVYYPGSRLDWRQISIAAGNAALTEAERYCELGFNLGRDNNSFSYSDTGYAPGSNARDLFDSLLNDYEKNALMDTSDRHWGGFSYGLSSLMGLVFDGGVPLGAISSGTPSSFFELPAPSEDPLLSDTALVYQLSQYLIFGGGDSVFDACTADRVFPGGSSSAVFLNQLVSTLSEEEEAVALAYGVLGYSHAVIASGCDDDAAGSRYIVNLYDMNVRDHFIKMYIPYSDEGITGSFSFDASGPSGVMNVNEGNYTFLKSFSFDELVGNAFVDRAGAYGSDLTVISVAASSGAFTLKDGTSGEELAYDGTGFSGNTGLITDKCLVVNGDGAGTMIQFAIPATSGIELSNIAGDIDISILTPGLGYLSLSGSNIDYASLVPSSEGGAALVGTDFSFSLTAGLAPSGGEPVNVRISADSVKSTALIKNHGTAVSVDSLLEPGMEGDRSIKDLTAVISTPNGSRVIRNSSPVESAYIVPDSGSISGFSFDKDYIVLQAAGGEAPLAFTEDLSAFASMIEISIEDIAGENCVKYENGTVTAQNEGTSVITAKLPLLEKTYIAQCRVDVTDGPVKVNVEKASLADKKATVELLKTDYTKIDVLLEMDQLLNDAAGLADPEAPQDNGAAVKSAVFDDEKTAAMFRLRVADDRTLEIIPTEEALANQKAVAKAYTSTITLNVDGESYRTDALTLAVKKTLPKLKIASVKFNSYNADDLRYLVNTGSTVTGLQLASEAPAWMRYNGDMSISLVGGIPDGVPAKASGKLAFSAVVDGWTGTYPVTVSYSVASTVPKITFSASSVNLIRNVGGSATVSVKKITPAEFEDSAVTLDLIKEGTAVIENGTVLDCSVKPDSAGIIHISWGPNAPRDALSHAYKLFYSIEGKQYSFTVKSPKPASPVLTLKSAGTIETNLAGSFVNVSSAFKNLNFESPARITEWFISDSYGKAANAKTSGQFVLSYVDGGTDCVIMPNTEDIPAPGTYYVTANAGTDAGTVRGTAKFTVKSTALAKLPASASLKAKGSIDVIRPATSVTLTPAVKNLYLYTLDEASLVIGTMVNKVFTPMENAPFDVSYDGTVFTLKAKDGIQSAVKYYAVLKVNENLSSKAAAVSVKMGKAKITSDVKEVSLFARDRYCTADINLGTADTALSHIAKVELDSKSLAMFDLKDMGNGQYVIGYAGDVIPDGFKPGISKTVKLNVFLYGNTTAKPNSSVSVKVLIK